MNPLGLALAALAVFCAAFAVLYAVARRMDNYGIVDIAWSYAFGVFALGSVCTAPGWGVRRGLFAGMAVIWSLRLGTHLCIRVLGHHPVEDVRYQRLRQNWGGRFAVKMFWFYQLQAVSVVLLGLPFIIGMRSPSPSLRPLEIAGAVLWLVAVGGEALADAQLAAFRRNPARQGRICTDGLWRYSRHPNYFFEWLVWVAYFLFALASPWGWITFISPAGILFLLLRVTGIPMTEAESIRRKGDDYRRYQQTTNAFVPWLPKE